MPAPIVGSSLMLGESMERSSETSPSRGARAFGQVAAMGSGAENGYEYEAPGRGGGRRRAAEGTRVAAAPASVGTLPRREATISARSAEPAARCATAFALLPLRSPHSTRLPPSTRRDAEATTRPDQVSRGVTGAFQLPSCDAYGAMPCGKTACRGGPPSFGSTDDQSSSCTMSDLPEASTAPQPVATRLTVKLAFGPSYVFGHAVNSIEATVF